MISSDSNPFLRSKFRKGGIFVGGILNVQRGAIVPSTLGLVVNRPRAAFPSEDDILLLHKDIRVVVLENNHV